MRYRSRCYKEIGGSCPSSHMTKWWSSREIRLLVPHFPHCLTWLRNAANDWIFIIPSWKHEGHWRRTKPIFWEWVIWTMSVSRIEINCRYGVSPWRRMNRRRCWRMRAWARASSGSTVRVWLWHWEQTKWFSITSARSGISLWRESRLILILFLPIRFRVMRLVLSQCPHKRVWAVQFDTTFLEILWILGCLILHWLSLLNLGCGSRSQCREIPRDGSDRFVK